MSLGFLTLDILIILVILIGTFIYSFNAGKKQVVKLLLTFYPTLLIFLNLPIKITDDLTNVLIFIGIYIAIFVLLKKNFTAPPNHSKGRNFIDSLLISIASVFILLTIYYKVVPLESIYTLNLPFSGLLVEKIPFYLTAIIPIIIILITNRRDD